MAGQKQDDQLKLTYSSYVGIRDVALKACQRRWMIRRSGERGSGISVLAAWHDDDERWVERHILRERTSSSHIFFQKPGGANACTPLQARQRQPDQLCVSRLTAILCTLPKSDCVVLITWSPSGYTPVVPDCPDRAVLFTNHIYNRRNLFNKTHQSILIELFYRDMQKTDCSLWWDLYNDIVWANNTDMNPEEKNDILQVLIHDALDLKETLVELKWIAEFTRMIWFGLVWLLFKGISTLAGYLLPNLFFWYIWFVSE